MRGLQRGTLRPKKNRHYQDYNSNVKQGNLLNKLPRRQVSARMRAQSASVFIERAHSSALAAHGRRYRSNATRISDCETKRSMSGTGRRVRQRCELDDCRKAKSQCPTPHAPTINGQPKEACTRKLEIKCETSAELEYRVSPSQHSIHSNTAIYAAERRHGHVITPFGSTSETKRRTRG